MTLHNFTSSKPMTLQPGDTEKPGIFEITVCSSATANDGYIPFSTTVSEVVVTAYKDDGTDVTSTMVEGTPSLSNNIITALLNHIAVDGEYYLYFLLTLDSGTTIGTYFKNIKVRGN